MSSRATGQGNHNRPGCWPLQQAKSRLSELVRLAQTQGPQHVTVHGKACAVVLSEDDYKRLTGARSGQMLVDVMAASPLKNVTLDHPGVRGPVRDVEI